MTFVKSKSEYQQKIIPTESQNTIFPLKPIDTGTDRNVTAKHEFGGVFSGIWLHRVILPCCVYQNTYLELKTTETELPNLLCYCKLG